MAEPNLPEVPAAQNVQIPGMPTSITLGLPFQPVTSQQYLDLQRRLFNQQLGQIRPLTDAMLEMQQDYGPGFAQQRLDMEQQFGPAFAQHLMDQLEIANPEFMPMYNELGGQFFDNLQLGMEMGPELEHEVEQAIRAAQTARGNVMGNAPTAQEAFGKGSAALALYNQRLGQAQNFLNSKQPTDMWGALGQASGYMPIPSVYPQITQLSGVAGGAFGTIAQSQSNYNQTAASTQASLYGSYTQGLIGAAQVNNQSAFDRYNAQFDQFLYQQSVNNGLFSMPGGMGGGGGGMGMMGGILGGVGTALGGVGAAVGGGMGAGIGIAGAAAGAAAAICWLARKVAPENWKSYRKYLFTVASDEERRDYIFNARRIANAI